MEAFKTGKIDIGFTRPLEPPYDRTLKAELLFNDPVVAVLPKGHPLAKESLTVESLAGERFVMCERAVTPALFDSILTLCNSAGFSPNIVNSSSAWPGVLTLVESGEGIALVPSGVRYLRTPGLVFAKLKPDTTHAGLSVVWDPRNEGPVVMDFLKLVRANKERIRKGV
jgi:DNA-binding transcriptional LysR family regulator